jgi:hypothetical protein
MCVDTDSVCVLGGGDSWARASTFESGIALGMGSSAHLQRQTDKFTLYRSLHTDVDVVFGCRVRGGGLRGKDCDAVLRDGLICFVVVVVCAVGQAPSAC